MAVRKPREDAFGGAEAPVVTADVLARLEMEHLRQFVVVLTRAIGRSSAARLSELFETEGMGEKIHELTDVWGAPDTGQWKIAWLVSWEWVYIMLALKSNSFSAFEPRPDSGEYDGTLFAWNNRGNVVSLILHASIILEVQDAPPDRTSVAAILQHHRKRVGLTQAQLAKAAGIVQAQVSQIEAGIHQPRLPTLMALAEVLDIDPCALIPRRK